MNYQDLETFILKRQALSQALTLFSWDQETEAPEDSMEQTTTYVGILSNELFQLITNPQVRTLLTDLSQQELPVHQKQLSENGSKIFNVLKKFQPRNIKRIRSSLCVLRIFGKRPKRKQL